MHKVLTFFIRILAIFIPMKQLRRKFRNFCCSYVNSSIQDYGKNNKLILIKNNKEILNPKIKGLKVIFGGSNSVVKLSTPIKFKDCRWVLGNNNKIEIKSAEHINKLDIPHRMSDNTTLFIDEDFSCEGAIFYLHDEPDKEIIIGKDCMFSFGITLWPSDGHSIFNNKGELINFPQKKLTIGNHVWIGHGALILKNSAIPDGSIIGARSLVNKAFSEKNTIIAGTPAKIVKRDILWNRKYPSYYAQKMVDDKNV